MAPNDNAQLLLLTTRKEYIFRDMQILYDLSNDILTKNKASIGTFKCRYKRIELIRKEFIEVVNEINKLILKMNPEETIDYKCVESFDTLYYAVHTAAEEILPPSPSLASVAGTTAHAHTAVGTDTLKPSAQARLPKIELPKFDGNLELWQTFYDTFLSLIHDNNNLSAIEKFHYLLSSLTGSALSVAKGIPVTANNYSIVFDALVNRFQNKRLLATNYLNKICTYPAMKFCNLIELKNMTSVLYESANALKVVGIPNLGEFILFYLASRNLDNNTRKCFESQNHEQIPTFENLLQFLQNYVKILEASEPSVLQTPHTTSLHRVQQQSPNYRNADIRTRIYRPEKKSLSLPVNTSLCSDLNTSDIQSHTCVAPYLDYVTHENTEPYLDSMLYDSTGPYSECKQDPEANPNYNLINECPFRGTYSAAISYNTSKFPDCVCCGFSHHSIYKCPLFFAYNLISRKKFVDAKQLCTNCLRPNHSVENCQSKSNCTKCNARHHTLLHEILPVIATTKRSSIIELEPSTPPVNTTSTMSSTTTSAHVGEGRPMIILGTCMVRVHGPSGTMKVRALIDSGAQDCFITTACVRRLGLPIRRCNITVAGLGQNQVHKIRGITSCSIQPQEVEDPSFDINPIIMDTITNKMPSIVLPPDVRKSCNHLVFADEEFDKPNDIDLLLGAELFPEFYDGRRLQLGPGLPVALHSVFGWVITGKLNHIHRPPPTITSSLLTTLALDQTIKRFWEIEEPPVVKTKNPDDEKCEELYSKLVTRKPDGRYVVPILLKEPGDILGDSYQSSLKRLFNLEKRWIHDNQLKENYVNFMREYSNLGHMQRVKQSVPAANIIPHHCVLRPDSLTTKLRVVFDGSAKTSNGKALNDLVYIGPKLQNDIVDIITKFRMPKVVFTADISKMYRNIQLRPEDRIYQHVLWRDSLNDPVSEFELTTVTYGVSSSPYLAIRTLHQLAYDHGAQWPRAAAILQNDTFMDDITAGAASLEEAVKLRKELIDLLQCGSFELRKWSSNSQEFLSLLPVEHCQTPKPFCDESNQHTLKILGIQWDPSQDHFSYSISELDRRCTKRIILSNIARIYDPLGWLTPVVLIAKLLIQQLWRLQVNWDEPVPDEVRVQWLNFCAELQHLHRIRIPRRIITSAIGSFELIGFCDGSMKAYGCCIYLRSSDYTRAYSHLLIAKSRVAPLKLLTINRLELLGAVLLARVLRHMCQLLRPLIAISRVAALTDSSTVLSWLQIPPHKLKTFVSHRVIKITDNVGVENWQHVSSHDNPADLCSRGLNCSETISSRIWWNGPEWLTNDSGMWPIKKQNKPLDNVPELKKPSSNSSLILVNSEETSFISLLLDQTSSYTHVQRIVAWCLRFVHNTRCKKPTRNTRGLTNDELEEALRILVKTEQAQVFAEDINNIKCQVNCSPAIQKLNPYIDEIGILRVGGRLKYSHLPKAAINPLLLPKRSRLSLLLIDYFHRLYLHCGPRTLQSLIQRKFWILGIRNIIRSRLSKCITCFKVKPKISYPMMGNLPPSRVQPSRCFQNVGIDFAGPFHVKESRRRNARINKAYVCVIICLAVKAIHIEIVSDLSTPAFIAALDRFVSRRGLCKQIISDCGTNFVGARRYLGEVNKFLLESQEEICENLVKRQIIWNFNPPTGSHFGGIFESGVKSLKHHLKRIVGLQVLTFEELYTVATKIEAVLNSRPLCLISSDPGEVDVLTPGHFLTGGPLVSLPEPGLENKHIPATERWQLIKKITQCFWRVWQQDYLHTLQQRAKWFRGHANLEIGQVVLIVDQNASPLEWRLGKVVAIHPGSDGVVRVITLRTEKGMLKRPVTKVCPLPITD